MLGAGAGELIFEEGGQRISTIIDRKRKSISENATLRIYQDRFEIQLNENDNIVIPLDTVKLVMSISIEALLIIDQERYFYIKTHKPRATSKYVAAYRYLIGKDYK